MSAAADWLKSREDWLRVIATPNIHGGFDIAVVVDGTYSIDHNNPRELCQRFANQIAVAMKTDGVSLGARPTLEEIQ
jgi:hypothetical protein